MLTPILLIDVIPVILASVSLYYLQAVAVRSTKLYLAAIAAILLIICQSSWIFSYVIDKPLVTTSVDLLWTVFNAIVMWLAILTIRDHHV